MLYIIDGIAPFFASHYCRNRKLNWSKIPFEYLENNGRLDARICSRIVQDFKTYAHKASAYGYNAITLDDVAHLVVHEFYHQRLKDKIGDYQDLYRRLFKLAAQYRLQVFVTSDVMFFNPFIEKNTGDNQDRITTLLTNSLQLLFTEFSQVKGVIARFGETDGLDVNDSFHSKLVIRKPAQCRKYVRSMLRACRKFDRLLIVRTWTLGAYDIGDLMWNEKTYQAIFKGLPSRHLLISHKYGDTDFQRHLQLAPLVFAGKHKKILELQARREYEGFGEFPSFVGYDYEHLFWQLEHFDRLAGISVWAQTGGWSHFNKLTFLQNSSIWNEINAFVTVKIFRERVSADEALNQFAKLAFPGKPVNELRKLLKLSDLVIKELWYMPSFSHKQLYFRRIRVPTLIWVFWDTIIINHMVRKIMRRFVHDPRETIDQGYRALEKIEDMRLCAGELGIRDDSLEFMYDTCEILALAREYFLGTYSVSMQHKIDAAVRKYRRKYRRGFNIEYDFSPVHIRKTISKFIFSICLRNQPAYRMIDKYGLIKLTGWVYPLMKKWQMGNMPEFTRKQAMGIHIFFK
ncbi:MAG: hypothetical protein GF398_12225 [Chitinivibrionales bacterium]|nr:hypothetical protein [Chitinivibrionales bacterium]